MSILVEVAIETKVVLEVKTSVKDIIGYRMTPSLRAKIIAVCEAKIAQKGASVGLSFYAFFKNKNENPELLMEVATWWIKTQELDHFEKAIKIKELVT